MTSSTFRFPLPAVLNKDVVTADDFKIILDYYLKHFMLDWFGSVGVEDVFFVYEYRVNYRSDNEVVFKFFSEHQY